MALQLVANASLEVFGVCVFKMDEWRRAQGGDNRVEFAGFLKEVLDGLCIGDVNARRGISEGRNDIVARR
ncbi:hypothetical protein CCASEI_10315 [Corynebacterium casei LMG S-19264]|uniref:Uncharacterized protein n=1 Tax=Corynebacterium casei LMG S-19264 TaxID=1285583 RepID=A0ABM5PRP5_9CORY|nr:hypothetical protein [Corynebacterium casei]AHI20618.1 hypothetical protein CCASEI_10315 [Corynebacterium casei LMG S-19264]